MRFRPLFEDIVEKVVGRGGRRDEEREEGGVRRAEVRFGEL